MFSGSFLDELRVNDVQNFFQEGRAVPRRQGFSQGASTRRK
jgi:hypothetical protein